MCSRGLFLLPTTHTDLTQAEFLLYQTEDGRTRVEVRFDGETAWLSLGQMADLFQRDKSVISRHIKNVFEEGELDRSSVVAEFATTAADGKTYQVEYFNLDVIISVGYRVKSHRGTQFRIWATQRLREYIVKGFTLDDERLKRGGGGNYFDELLARIRDIRSSEKVFWRKVLDIYATSIDYDPRIEASQLFFKTVQNKMHWAAHGHTAAEIIAARADAAKPNMGLTSWAGEVPRKTDVAVAKNYLDAEELEALNRIVTAYLEFAELQAMNRKPMYMADWISKLDDFLKLSDREILRHAGKVSHDDAVAKAEIEYERFAEARVTLPQPVEEHFEDAIRDVKRLEKGRRAQRPEKVPARESESREVLFDLVLTVHSNGSSHSLSCTRSLFRPSPRDLPLLPRPPIQPPPKLLRESHLRHHRRRPHLLGNPTKPRPSRGGGGLSYSKFSNNCRRRQDVRHQALQPLGHHRSGLQGQLRARGAVSQVGHARGEDAVTCRDPGAGPRPGTATRTSSFETSSNGSLDKAHSAPRASRRGEPLSP